MSSVIEKKGELYTCCVLSCTLLYIESELERTKKMNKTAFSQLDKLRNIVKAKESKS